MNVISTLKEQLVEARAEWTATRHSLEAAHEAGLRQVERAAEQHADARRAADAHGRAMEGRMANAKRAFVSHERELVAFCERWVPAVAEAERASLASSVSGLAQLLTWDERGGDDDAH